MLFLLRYNGCAENYANRLISRNRFCTAQQTKISALIIEEYKNLVADALFFDAYAAVLKKREEIDQWKQARVKEKAVERRAKRQARLKQPALCVGLIIKSS
ncbi:MAG: hypothetical protein PF588_06410 [Candidatus Kapabacteria bacterium]|jgi:hypothetical protein|nr:hypothetical protein [Candidatus Kapabacteria bacterium]